MKLHVNHKRAISMLAQGRSATAVSIDLDVCRQTLGRWKKIPEFQAALDRTVAELALNSRNQVEATARIAIEGGLDAVKQLHNLVLRENTSDHNCRLACNALVRITERFWDLLGYNAKYAKKETLLCDQHGVVSGAPSIGEPVIPRRPKPGDREQRDLADVDPQPPGAHALSSPPEFYDWRYRPVNDDGTPKKRKRPLAPRLPEKPKGPSSEHVVPPDPRRIEVPDQPAVAPVAKPDPATHAVAAKAAVRPSRPSRPRRRGKAWKRSATTARCKPSAPLPIAAGTTRAIAEVFAARHASGREQSNHRAPRPAYGAHTASASDSELHGPG